MKSRLHIDLTALRAAAEQKIGTPVTPTIAAEMVLVSRRAWQRWENDNKTVPVGVVKRFCLVAGLDYTNWIPKGEYADEE